MSSFRVIHMIATVVAVIFLMTVFHVTPPLIVLFIEMMNVISEGM